MSTTDDLHQAGLRAAERAVAIPSIESLVDRASAQRRRRRAIVGSGLVSLVLVAGIPLALAATVAEPEPSVLISSQDPDEAGEGTGSIDDPDGAPDEDAGEDGADSDIAPDSTEPDTEPTPKDRSARGDFAFADGTYSVAVISGDDATDRAADAEASADETRVLEGSTIWIERSDDSTTVSALVEDDLFVEVTGPSEEVDELLSMLTEYDGSFPLEFHFPGGLGTFDELPPGIHDRFLDELDLLGDLRDRFPDFDCDPADRNSSWLQSANYARGQWTGMTRTLNTT